MRSLTRGRLLVGFALGQTDRQEVDRSDLAFGGKERRQGDVRKRTGGGLLLNGVHLLGQGYIRIREGHGGVGVVAERRGEGRRALLHVGFLLSVLADHAKGMQLVLDAELSTHHRNEQKVTPWTIARPAASLDSPRSVHQNYHCPIQNSDARARTASASQASRTKSLSALPSSAE